MSMYDSMAKSHPKMARGQVWCITCGRSALVATADCLRRGWPECCGETMSLDSPEERRRSDEQVPSKGAGR